MIQVPEFKDKSELFRWLKTNKHLIMTEKKSQLKYADPVIFQNFTITNSGTVEKAVANLDLLNLSEFNVKVVINTTNLMDSHSDVHVPGIWKKSLSENRMLYLLQEHEMKFDHIISDRVQAYTKTMSWKELGFNWEGKTQALVFDATIEKDRNPFMSEQYAKARVKNHSVGMQYVKMEMAINSEGKFDQEEKAAWDKYYPMIINQEKAEEQGYFFAITEGRAIEGSAVPLGSNFVTPTISIGKETLTLDEADPITSSEPLDMSRLAKAIINLKLN